MNYSRNIKGRLASCIHARNNGPGTSVIAKTKNVGLELCDDLKKSLYQMDNECEYHKLYEKKKTNINRRLRQLGIKYITTGRTERLQMKYLTMKKDN